MNYKRTNVNGSTQAAQLPSESLLHYPITAPEFLNVYLERHVML